MHNEGQGTGPPRRAEDPPIAKKSIKRRHIGGPVVPARRLRGPPVSQQVRCVGLEAVSIGQLSNEAAVLEPTAPDSVEKDDGGRAAGGGRGECLAEPEREPSRLDLVGRVARHRLSNDHARHRVDLSRQQVGVGGGATSGGGGRRWQVKPGLALTREGVGGLGGGSAAVAFLGDLRGSWR